VVGVTRYHAQHDKCDALCRGENKKAEKQESRKADRFAAGLAPLFSPTNIVAFSSLPIHYLSHRIAFPLRSLRTRR